MHELPITQSILEITLRHAEQANAQHVAAINIVVGQLSSVIDDSVQFYWDMISEGTIAQGAILHFQRNPVILQCLACKNEYIPSDEDFTCPNCHGESIKIISGEEFYLDSIEVE